MMSITDGLQHYGNIEVPNDINYYHGYGLKALNRLPLGFIGHGRYFKKQENYLNPVNNRDFLVTKDHITVCPKYGLIIRHTGNNTFIYDKNLTLVKTISTPTYSDSARSGVAENGDTLVVHDNKFTIITHGGTIKKTASHNESSSSATYFNSVHVDSKRDKFFFVSTSNGQVRYHIGKYSTLEIKHTFTAVSSTTFSSFLTNGYILSSYSTTTTGIVTIYKIDDTTYNLSVVRTDTAVPFSVVCVDHNGKVLGLGPGVESNKKDIYSLNTDNLSYVKLGSLPKDYAISDADKHYYYCANTLTNFYGYHVVDRRTLEEVFVYKITTSLSDELDKPYPIQMRGKMPQCRAFHK